jgi:small-conductance mechanosensitive channel
MKNRHALFLLIVVVSVILLSVWVAGEEQPPATPTASVTATLGSAALTPEPAAAPEGESVPTEGIVEAIASRTPEPSPTPGLVQEVISEFSSQTGLNQVTFLGLSGEDWINLGISLLIVLVGYLVAGWIVKVLLPQFLKRTTTEVDDAFLEKVGTELRWMLTLLPIQFAIERLQFIPDQARTTLNDIYFVLYLSIIFYILWKLLDFAIEWYQPDTKEEKDRYATLVTVIRRGGRITIVFLYLSFLLTHFGLDISAVLAAAGILGLAFSLAAQDTLADAISGIVILIDQPFRIGDRIEIESLGTWGDVVDIGTRTTRIRTRDNRMVIVPNSTIGSSQVVNYTYPDPQYRVQVDIGIGYGQDVEKVRQVIIEAVRHVEGVLPDKPVDALYNEMGDSWMTFRVRWWIESYEDTRRIYDRVNTALQHALDEAGIDSPFNTLDINIKLGPEQLDRLTRPPAKS